MLPFLTLGPVATPLSAADFGYTLPASNAVYVLPPAGATAPSTAWATSTVYATGARVLARGEPYFCVLPGTSGVAAVAATNFVAAQTSDGTVTWIRPLRRARSGLAITVNGDGDIYINVDAPASSGKGLKISAGDGPTWLTDQFGSQFQGSLSLYSTSTVTVTGVEW